MPCGINEKLDIRTGECVCKEGYGRHEGKCDICPSAYFIVDGYCVSCPLNSIYNAQNNKC